MNNHYTKTTYTLITCTLSLCMLTTLTACDGLDGLVDGAYSGEPVLSFQVDLSGTTTARPGASVLPIIFWSNTGTTTALDFKSSEGALGRYTMELKRTLPESAYKRVINRRKTRLIGRIILFEDLDDDGEWDAGQEAFVGGSNSHVVIFHNDLTPGTTQRYSLARLLGCMTMVDDHIELLQRQIAREELVTVLLANEQSFNEDIDCDQIVDDPCLTIEASMSQACQELYARDCYREEVRVEEIVSEPAFHDFEHEDFDRLQDEFIVANDALTQCYEVLEPVGMACSEMNPMLCMNMMCPEGYLLETQHGECICEDTSDRDPMSGQCLSEMMSDG